MDFKKGDILRATVKEHVRHPLVYWEDEGGDFIGIMLTHSGKSEKYNNIPLDEDFIEKEDQNGENFDFQFDDTQMVGDCLLKKAEWAPYWKVGELTSKGIDFISQNIHPDKADYYYNIKSFWTKE